MKRNILVFAGIAGSLAVGCAPAAEPAPDPIVSAETSDALTVSEGHVRGTLKVPASLTAEAAAARTTPALSSR